MTVLALPMPMGDPWNDNTVPALTLTVTLLLPGSFIAVCTPFVAAGVTDGVQVTVCPVVGT